MGFGEEALRVERALEGDRIVIGESRSASMTSSDDVVCAARDFDDWSALDILGEAGCARDMREEEETRSEGERPEDGSLEEREGEEEVARRGEGESSSLPLASLFFVFAFVHPLLSFVAKESVSINLLLSFHSLYLLLFSLRTPYVTSQSSVIPFATGSATIELYWSRNSLNPIQPPPTRTVKTDY